MNVLESLRELPLQALLSIVQGSGGTEAESDRFYVVQQGPSTLIGYDYDIAANSIPTRRTFALGGTCFGGIYARRIDDTNTLVILVGVQSDDAIIALLDDGTSITKLTGSDGPQGGLPANNLDGRAVLTKGCNVAVTHSGGTVVPNSYTRTGNALNLVGSNGLSSVYTIGMDISSDNDMYLAYGGFSGGYIAQNNFDGTWTNIISGSGWASKPANSTEYISAQGTQVSQSGSGGTQLYSFDGTSVSLDSNDGNLAYATRGAIWLSETDCIPIGDSGDVAAHFKKVSSVWTRQAAISVSGACYGGARSRQGGAVVLHTTGGDIAYPFKVDLGAGTFTAPTFTATKPLNNISRTAAAFN